MMPPTATYEDIKAYQDKVEKNKITPHSLPPCPHCQVESSFFKVHAYRERRFLIIVETIVRYVFCTLVRFSCPGCGKTMTLYPDFALPHKHYTRQTIMGFAAAYLAPKATYQLALMVENDLPGYPNSDATLAPSSIQRWITSLARYPQTCRRAIDLLTQQTPVSSVCRDLAQPHRLTGKSRSKRREQQLLSCRRLLILEDLFQEVFKISIFTKLAIACGFG